MDLHHGVILLLVICDFLLHTKASEIGDKISVIVTNFADEGLGTRDMQNYVNSDVNFETETIDERTVEQIASQMTLKIKGYLLKELRDYLLSSDVSSLHTTEIGTADYLSCCDITPQGGSKMHEENVNLDEWCLLGEILAESGTEHSFLPTSVRDKFKDIYDRAGDIKYVYFGTEDGILYNYPGVRIDNCGSSDPRFRTWYVETYSPDPKDVVIVIDKSQAMRHESESSPKKSLMYVAITAAVTVLETLNPNDRVGIVIFSTDIEDKNTVECYRTTLATANKDNKEYLKNSIFHLSPGGGRSYTKALDKAFEYFRNTPKDGDGKSRDKVLLFLTGGAPDEPPETVYSTLRDLNGQLGNQVVVLTYLFSTASNEDAEGVLTNMTKQTFSNSSLGNVVEGEFKRISKLDNLRSEMAGYYNAFQSFALNAEPTFSLPFVKTFESSGVQISMCLPLPRTLILDGGVVCFDILVDEILSDVTYFRKGGLAYAFVIDSNSRVLSHPLLPNPAYITDQRVFIQLHSLEVGDGIEEVRQSMIRREVGKKNVQTRKVTPRGSLDTEGVESKTVDSTYYWHPVNRSSFSVCIVKTNSEDYQRVAWKGEFPGVFTYHKNRIASNPGETCKYFAREALKGQGNVKFAPRSFLNPYVYILGDETPYDYQEYTKYFTGQTNGNTFRSDVRDHVAFSYKFEELMKTRQTYGDYAVWRYFGTEAGVLRLYPGAEISTMYDPSLRSWYLRAMSSPSTYAISTPYVDAFGAGVVITLSKAILSPSANTAVGVMGVDFTMPYFYYLLTQDIPECSSDDCLFIDSSGFVILNSKWFVPGAPEIEYIEGIHISSVEPEIAYDLADIGILDDLSCINMKDLQEQKFWKMVLYTGIHSTSWYELHEISGTNIFLLIKKGLPTEAKMCYCPSPQNDIELCSPNKECFCPCFTPTDSYNHCSGNFSLTLNGNPPCSPPIPSVDFSQLTASENSIIQTLDPCRDYKCSQRDSREQCVGVASCKWCNLDGKTSSFCGAYGECHLGPPVTPATSTPEPDSPEGIATWIIAVAAVGGLLLIIAVIVIIICIKKRRSRKAEQKKQEMVANQYEHTPCKGDEEEDLYHKLRESKLDLSTAVSSVPDDTVAKQKMNNLNPRPYSAGIPQERPPQVWAAPKTSKTLPASVTGLSEEYGPSAESLSKGEYIGLQNLPHMLQHQDNPSSTAAGPVDDVYLRAGTVPPKPCPSALARAEAKDDDVYLKAADVNGPSAP